MADSIESPEGFKDNTDVAVSQFTMSGSDSSFVSGVIRLGLDGPFVQNHPVGIGVDAIGRIAVDVELSSRTGNTSGVARLNADGSLDTTFGHNGIGTTVPIIAINTILVQPNNEIIAIGGGNLARYLAQ